MDLAALGLDRAPRDTLQIVDGHNWFRVKLETEPAGLAVRNALRDVLVAPSPPIFVFDGVNANARRRAHYPDYKMSRVSARDDIYHMIELFHQMLAFVPSVAIRAYGWEADDVIATLAERRAKVQKVRVVTRDKDLSQLAVRNSNIEVTSAFKPEQKVPPHFVRLYKTLVGDSSDNIKGLPQFGDKSWLGCNKTELQVVFEKRDPSRLEHPKVPLDITKAQADRMIAHFDQLLVYWDIIGLYDVPEEEITKSMKVGSSSWHMAEKLMQEFQL